MGLIRWASCRDGRGPLGMWYAYHYISLDIWFHGATQYLVDIRYICGQDEIGVSMIFRFMLVFS